MMISMTIYVAPTLQTEGVSGVRDMSGTRLTQVNIFITFMSCLYLFRCFIDYYPKYDNVAKFSPPIRFSSPNPTSGPFRIPRQTFPIFLQQITHY